VPILGAGGGRLVTLGTTVDAKTRTVPLVYEVPNPEGRLRIGMALNVYVETAHSTDALVVPVAALVEEDGRSIAYVQVSGETFAKRDLTLGIRDGAFVQVLAGLTAGERVVTKGAYAIRLASVSATLPAHGHAH
jgi:multidrug efflux pump subunit AcrA (membrane-fusion protein)